MLLALWFIATSSGWRKLFIKETILPSGANKILFAMAPMLTFILSLIAWAVIPFDAGMVLADINVGILYLLLFLPWAFTG